MKAIGYIRVSTSRQDLERQDKLIREYCTIKNYSIVEIYSDKKSGATNNREAFIKMLQVDKSQADVLIVSELSRLSRKEEILRTLNELNLILQNGLDLVFLDDESKVYKGGSTLDLIDIITLAVKAQQASDERKKITTRMITGRKAKAASFTNMFTGGRVPYGYKKVANPNYKLYVTPKSLLVVDEQEAKVIKDIYSWIAEGASLRDVAKRLQGLGIKTDRGNDFSAIIILKMVKNPIYMGVWKFKDEIFSGDAIVTKQIWDKANDSIKNRALRPTSEETIHYNPLRGIIKCSCGKSMTIAPANKHLLFRCSTKKDMYDRVICTNGSISSELILQAVWKCVKMVVSMEEYMVKNSGEIDKMQLEIEEIDKAIALKDSEVEELRKQQNNLVDSLTSITDDGLRSRINVKYLDIDSKIETTIKDINKLGRKKMGLKKLAEQIRSNNGKKYLDGLTDIQKRNIYLRELEKVTFHSNKRKRGFLVVTFKNGYERVLLLRSRKYPDIFLLPASFSMCSDECKVEVEIMKKTDNPFELQGNLVRYDSVELEKSFNLSEWNIAD